MIPASCPSGRSRLLLRAYDGLGSMRSFEIQRLYSNIHTSPRIQGGVRNCPLGSRSHSSCRGASVIPSAVTGAEEVAMQIIPGSVYPLGPSAYRSEDGSVVGVNFAVASVHAKNVQLVLFDVQGKELSTLNLFFNEQEGVWHGAVPNLPKKDILYGLKVSGDGGWETPFRWDSQRVLLDPWAPYVVGRSRFGIRDEFERFVSPVRSSFIDITLFFFPWSI